MDHCMTMLFARVTANIMAVYLTGTSSSKARETKFSLSSFLTLFGRPMYEEHTFCLNKFLSATSYRNPLFYISCHSLHNFAHTQANIQFCSSTF